MLVLRVGHANFCRGGNAMVLQQHGIRSEQAASGREALEYLRLYAYDLVLMDLQLPDVPAYEVVRMMRAASLKTPVVIMSDTATVQAKVKALDQGADDFLLTPCDPEEVLARICSSSAFADVPTLLFTSSDSAQDRERCLQLGANAYIRKPSNLAAFMRIGKMVKDLTDGH